MSQVFLIATHLLNDATLALYHEIREATAGAGETRILYHEKNIERPPAFARIPIHTFTDAILYESGYTPIAKALIPGSNHFSLLHFFLQNSPYEYYWYIENDVRFMGQWKTFFDACQPVKADMISAQLELYENRPGWRWWDSLIHPTKSIPHEKRVCSFNPIYRLSFRALAFIHQALLDRWMGHHEVLLPTLLYNNNFSIVDFGADGVFTPPGFLHRFYSWKTHRWRPVCSQPGPERDKIYHPVK